MAEAMTIHKIDEELNAEFQKLIDEAEQWTRESAEKREKAMKEAAELAKGKELFIGKDLKQDLVNDHLHQRIVKLSLPEVLIYSGQGRHATKRELREAHR